MVHEDKPLQPLQELYVGLLGDQYLTKIKRNRKNSALSIVHSSTQVEYTMYKYSLIQDFVRKGPHSARNLGWGKEVFRSLAYPVFTRARLICYPNGSLNCLGETRIATNKEAARVRKTMWQTSFCMMCGTIFRRRGNQITCNKTCRCQYDLLQKKKYRLKYSISKSKIITTTLPTGC